jgi:hypothetical protein
MSIKESHDDVAGPNVVWKFGIKKVGRIQAPIVSYGLQKGLIDVIGLQTKIISMPMNREKAREYSLYVVSLKRKRW